MIDIDQLTEEELIDLNHRIVQRLRLIEQMRSHVEMMKFRIGARVAFDPDGRPTVVGTLTRFNKKSVTVITDNGQKWNVAPSFLREVKPGDAGPRADADSLRLRGN